MSARITTLPGTIVRVEGVWGRHKYHTWLRVTYSSAGMPSVWLRSCVTGQYHFVRPERVIGVRKPPAWTRTGPMEAVA